MTRLRLLGTLLWVIWVSLPLAQGSLTKRIREGDTQQPMTQAELNDLGDPMFALVLRDNPQAVSLDDVERLIKGDSGTRQLFVVHEELQKRNTGGQRRAVITFTGTNRGIQLAPNVALSVSFDDRQVVPGFIEAWGWDNQRSRYNYYKLDGTSWSFRGSSVDAEQLTSAQRANTCLACHINGGPVMKELPIPWNNWHSFRNLAPYLSPSGANHWTIAESPRFADLRGAETLETQFILPSIRQFNGRRLNALVRQVDAVQEEVQDGPRALRPLFETTEYNITSANQASGLHPFPTAGTGPTTTIQVPDTFFLNANILAGGGITQYEGLGVSEAREFGSLLTLKPDEYAGAVRASNTRIGGVAGDTQFGWFVPEPSHIDNHMIDALIRRGVITRQFAAAVLSIDLENPVFSQARAKLLAAVPRTFRFTKRVSVDDVPSAHPDALTTAVIANLRGGNPMQGSPERELLDALQSPDPVAVLRSKVVAFRDRVRSSLAGLSTHQPEIRRLYGVMLDRRGAAASANGALIESRFLFPRRPGQ